VWDRRRRVGKDVAGRDAAVVFYAFDEHGKLTDAGSCPTFPTLRHGAYASAVLSGLILTPLSCGQCSFTGSRGVETVSLIEVEWYAPTGHQWFVPVSEPLRSPSGGGEPLIGWARVPFVAATSPRCEFLAHGHGAATLHLLGAIPGTSRPARAIPSIVPLGDVEDVESLRISAVAASLPEVVRLANTNENRRARDKRVIAHQLRAGVGGEERKAVRLFAEAGCPAPRPHERWFTRERTIFVGRVALMRRGWHGRV
jgi:hypothetical protein